MSALHPWVTQAIERMAEAGVRDSLPTNGMFNEHQLDAMRSGRMPTYRRIAEVMLCALLGCPSGAPLPPGITGPVRSTRRE